MNLKRLCSVFTLSLAGALLVMPACSSDSPEDMGGGGLDLGMGPPPPPPPQMDMGPPPPPPPPMVDMGPRDMGPPPPPPPPPPGGAEGEPCRNDPMNACDAELTCVNWSGQNVMNPVTTCTRLCMGNADCAGSAYPGATCSEPILTDGSGICVGGVVTEEGGVANLAGNPATACAADLTGARSILFGLADGEQSCVRPCNNDGECTGTAGFCDIDPTITATDTPAGTCMTRLRGPGSICSDRDGTAGCSNDTQTMGLLVCFAPPIGYPDGTLPANSGVCLGVCGNNLQGIPNNCVTPHDPTLNPTCLTGGVIFTNPDLGICDDRCSAFPDRCTGPGWDNGNGQDCVQLALNMGGSGDFDEPDITYCIDRIPPFLDVWDSASMMLPSPQQNCATSPFSCPDGTNCFGVDANTAGCVYGCSATATVSGCEQSTTGTTCNSLADLNVIMSADESGLCQSVGF